MNDSSALIADPRLNDVRALMTRMKAQFSAALPKHITPERLMRVALTACQKTPKLLDCTPKSFAAAMMTAAQVGLEPDGTLGRAYLIPRKNNKNGGVLEANFQFGYQGLLDLCYRTGDIASVRAEVVRKGDRLVAQKGIEEKLEHVEGKDNFEAEITHVYAIIRTKSAGVFWDCWPAEKVEAHRRRFAKDGREDSVWNTDWPAMAKKTLLIAVLKYAPKSIESAYAVDADETGGMDMDFDVVDAKPVQPPSSIADLKEQERAGRDGTIQSGPAKPPQEPAKEPEPAPPASSGGIPPRRRTRKEAPAEPGDETLPFGQPEAPAPPAPAPAPTGEAPGVYLKRALVAEVNTRRSMVSSDLFDALVKKHMGSTATADFSLGTDGLRNLRDELDKAIG